MKFPPKSGGGVSKHIVKLKAEESIIGVFRGELHEFKQHWGSDNKSTLCAGSSCAFCESGGKPSYRFRLNFVVQENGAFVAKVFEQGWVVREQLESLNEDYPLEHNWFKISRKGNGKETSYTILPIKNPATTKEQEQKLLAVALHSLDPGKAPATAVEESTDTDIPF